MSKAIDGAAMLGGAFLDGVAMFAMASTGVGVAALPFMGKLMAALVMGGISMEAGAIAEALTSNRGQNITTRQAAAYRQIVRGTRRVGGVDVYQSTTGSHKDQYNFVIVFSGHEIDSFVNLYLDGRQVYWLGSGGGYSVRNGVGFGGVADPSDHVGPDGQTYNFGGTGHSGIYCEARYGDQSPGDVISGLTANDPTWAARAGRSPYLGGCAYIYLKLEANTNLFPTPPEIRITMRGKNNILDPRDGTRKFTNNWALMVADVLTDPTFGLGDDTVNQDQLIAAANISDEMVPLADGINEEFRYCCDFNCDTSMGPGDTLDMMAGAAAGRLSRIGGEWYIWPAAWTSSTFSFDKSHIVGPMTWTPNRSLRDLDNRRPGTYTAPNYPYNVAGNVYDSNGWYNGGIQNNFPFAFQPTSFPGYACDVRHGFANDAFLEDDSGVQGAWSSATTYNDGDVITYLGGIYKSIAGSNTNNLPNAVSSAFWAPYATYLRRETSLLCVLSVAQAQRVAKIMLLRNRQQGTGSFPMHLECFQMQPESVMEFSFPELGWTNKVLEIFSTNFRVEPGSGAGDAPSVRTDFGVQETASSVYDWDPTTDELTVYDLPAGLGPSTVPRDPDAPTSLVLTSDATTAVVAKDGTVTPRILASWVAPLDSRIVQVQVQYELHASGTWLDAGAVDSATTSLLIAGVIVSDVYDVRVRSLTSKGATSDWTETDSVTVVAPNSLQTTYSNNPQISLSNPTSTSIAMAATSVTFGGTTVTYAARTFTITAPSVATDYYLTIFDPTQVGESGSPTLTPTLSLTNALVGVLKNTYMGAIKALPGGSADRIAPGGWPSSQSFELVP